MATNIRSYVSNLIAGRDIIANLYCAADNARYGINNSHKFCYKVVIPGIGNKTYTSLELFNLDTKAFCTPLDKLVAEIDGKITINQYVTLLLYGRMQIKELYQARYKAINARSTNKTFQYIFNNPYGQYADVNRNSITFRNSILFLNFFCESSQQTFDPFLVFAGLFNNS